MITEDLPNPPPPWSDCVVPAHNTDPTLTTIKYSHPCGFGWTTFPAEPGHLERVVKMRASTQKTLDDNFFPVAEHKQVCQDIVALADYLIAMATKKPNESKEKPMSRNSPGPKIETVEVWSHLRVTTSLVTLGADVCKKNDRKLEVTLRTMPDSVEIVSAASLKDLEDLRDALSGLIQVIRSDLQRGPAQEGT